MSDIEVTQLKVSVARIETSLTSFIDEMKEWKKVQEKFLKLELDNVRLEMDNNVSLMNSHRAAIQVQIDNISEKLKTMRLIIIVCIVTILSMAGINVHGL